MKKSKLINVFSAAILVLGMISCSSAPKAETETPAAPVTETKEEAAVTPAETESAVIDMTPVFKCSVEGVSELPDTASFPLDDFEDGNYWYGVGDSWDQWGSHNLSIAAGVVKDWASNGTHSLKCIMEPATADTSKQATFCCNSLVENNLAGFKWVEVTVYNPNDWEYELNIAVQDGVKYEWNQSKSIMCGQGVTTCLFDISNMSDEFLENVYCFMIQSVNENPGKFFYIDNFVLYE